jgi:hypothetical protein
MYVLVNTATLNVVLLCTFSHTCSHYCSRFSLVFLQLAFVADTVVSVLIIVTMTYIGGVGVRAMRSVLSAIGTV